MSNGVNDELKKKVEDIRKGRKRKDRKNMIYLWLWTIVAYVIFANVAVYLINKQISIDSKNQWNLGWAILAMESLHFGLSFGAVGPKSLGAVLLFGRPLYQVRSGLVYAPFGICQLAKETSLVIKEQFPAEPELVDKSGDDTKPVQPGFVKPIRVATASVEMLTDEKSKAKAESFGENEPLNKMMVLEPSVIVRFQIQKDNFISFLTNIGSVDHAISQMRDTVDSVLNIEFPKRTPSLIIIEKEEINKKLKEEIEDLVGERSDSKESWGIDVLNVQIADIDMSKKIHRSLRDITDSMLQAAVTVTKAKAAKEAVELAGAGKKQFKTDEGAGVANARLAFLQAEAKGLKEISEIAKTPQGKVVVISKTQEEALKNAKYSIVPEGVGSLISGVQEILKKIKSPDDDDNKKTGGKK